MNIVRKKLENLKEEHRNCLINPLKAFIKQWNEEYKSQMHITFDTTGQISVRSIEFEILVTKKGEMVRKLQGTVTNTTVQTETG